MQKKIKYSLLELAMVSEGVSMQETLHNALAVAKLAEETGYERLWFAEHHNTAAVASSATAVLIGYVAENTERIRVGAGGVMLPNHAPLIIAEQFGTLAQLYPDRIDLGLGRAPGTDQVTIDAIRSDFYRATQAFPQEIQRLQQYFSPENKTAKVRAPLAEGTEVPLYILGSSTFSAQLAASKGLPYAFASHFATSHLINALRIYRQEFQPSEHLEAPYTIAGINVIIADTNEAAERIFTSLLGMFYGMITGNRGPIKPPTEMTDEWRQILHHPAIHQMLKYSFVGDKQTVKRGITEFIAETQVDELITVATMYDAQDRLKSIRSLAEVMEEING